MFKLSPQYLCTYDQVIIYFHQFQFCFWKLFFLEIVFFGNFFFWKILSDLTGHPFTILRSLTFFSCFSHRMPSTNSSPLKMSWVTRKAKFCLKCTWSIRSLITSRRNSSLSSFPTCTCYLVFFSTKMQLPSIHWMIDDRSIDWLFDCALDWLTDWPIDWLIDWFTFFNLFFAVAAMHLRMFIDSSPNYTIRMTKKFEKFSKLSSSKCDFRLIFFILLNIRVTPVGTDEADEQM